MKYFGTDGVRGIANQDLTCELAFSLGRAAVDVLGNSFVIGRDTRRSGSMLEAALVAGITSLGANVFLAGIVPTPAVAVLVREFKAQGGVVISASHNTPEYNGIKFFDHGGFKLTHEQEAFFEERLAHYLNAVVTAAAGAVGTTDIANSSVNTPVNFASNIPANSLVNAPLPIGTHIGTVQHISDATERYTQHAINVVRAQGIDLQGIKVALDCAHGASYQASIIALEALGAEVVAINNDFTADDINENCGSTHLDCIKQLVERTHADVGIAHDGDADRTLAISATGAVIDGDRILAICAHDLAQRGLLAKNTVVSTVMSNLGFIKCMEEHNITVVQTDVGDSNVLDALRAGSFVLGGEQSGHVIFSEYNSTGDGLITALMLLATLKRSKKSLDELAKIMCVYPQMLINVPVQQREKLEQAETVWKAVAAEETLLEKDGGGRVLVRASGTEPLVRVMVEAATQESAQMAAERISAVVSEALS